MKEFGFSRQEAQASHSGPGLHPLISDGREVPNGYYVVARHFPDAEHVEVCGIKLMSGEHLKRGGGARRKNGEKGAMDELTLMKSQQRAKTAVRRKCLALCTDRVLTLTFRDNVTDLGESWTVFKRFTKLMRQHYGESFKYVAVPELQKRGAVHFHLAISGFYPVKRVRDFWRKASGKRGGNIDITNPKKYGEKRWNPRSVARYISKYISKSDIAAFNKKRYSSGGCIEVPPAQKGWLALGMSVTQIFQQVCEKFSRHPIECVWESGDRAGIVFCST